MAVIPVKQVKIIALRSQRAAVFNALQNLRCIHLDEVRADELVDPGQLEQHALEELEAELRVVGGCIEFLGQYRKQKTSLLALPEQLGSDVLEQAYGNKAAVHGWMSTMEGMRDRIGELKSLDIRLNARIAQIAPWEALDVPVELLRNTQETVVAVGTLPRDRLEEFLQETESLSAWTQVPGTDHENAYILTIGHKARQGQVSALLDSCGFSRTSFEDMQGLPRDILSALRDELARSEQERAEIEGQLTSLAGESVTDLKLYYDAVMVYRDRAEEALKSAYTQSTVNILGWAREKDIPAIEAALARVSEDIYLEASEAGEEQDPPVLTENSALTQPFSAVTEMYAVPRRDEVDPTPLLAGFYFIFFGMMVSDAGYGFMVMILCGLLMMKMKDRTPKLIKLVGLGGISTLIWGALFGTWFGAEATPLWFNPMGEPLLMLGVCFAMGFVQILTGLGAKLYINIRNGDVLAALMDQVTWLVLLLGIPIMFLPGFKTVGTMMAAIGALGVVATNGRENKTIIGKAGGGLYALYNITGYLSDVLSYSRLFALGLATGVIGLVINTVCQMLTSFGWWGWIFAVPVFIGGHIFNISINLLGAFVHDARLQFVEFFGKFFEGGGRAFQAFTLRTRYNPIKVPHQNS